MVVNMPSLAKSAIAPILGQRIPIRGSARLLYRSYARAGRRPGDSPRRLTSKFGDDFNIDLSSYIEWLLWAFGSFEQHLAELFQHLVEPGDRCIDVGANIGIHTVRLAKLVGKRGEVIAIEPDEELARRATNNAILNHLTNVRVIQAAASEHAGGTVLLYRPGTHDSNKGRASMLPHSYLTGSAAKVATVTIDDINHGSVALIKIDVEGCESSVVAGATRTIDACFPSIIFEYDPDFIADKSQSPFGWLQEKGYELFGIHNDRHNFTGRGRLRLERLPRLPDKGANILACSEEISRRLSSLISSAASRS